MAIHIDGETIKAVGAEKKIHLVALDRARTLCGRFWRPTMQHYPKVTRLDDTGDDLCCGTCRRLGLSGWPSDVREVD